MSVQQTLTTGIFSDQAPRALLPAPLIVFAWIIEILGVACGVANAAFTTFGEAFPETLWGWIVALPLAVLAATELLRIPLAQASQQKRRRLVRLLSFAALVPLMGIAIENWTFGIERVVDRRLAAVEPARLALREAELTRERDDSQAATARASLERKVAEGAGHLEAIGRQITAEDQAHKDNLKQIGDYCLKIAGECLKPRSLEEDRRYAAEKAELGRQKARVLADLEAAKQSLQALADRAGEGRASDAERREEAARKTYLDQLSRNQIYRLAGYFYGVAPEKIEDGQLATARGFFSIFGACVISLLGTVAALVHYWPNTPSSSSRAFQALVRSLRAWIARRRRKVVREVPVEKIVETVVEKIVPEVEKPILVEKTVVRFVPYTGSGPLPPDESTVKRIEGQPAAEALDAARRNNARQLRVYK